MADLIENLGSVGVPTRTRVTSTRRLMKILKQLESETHTAMTRYCARQKPQSHKFRAVDMVTGADVTDPGFVPKDFTTFFDGIN